MKILEIIKKRRSIRKYKDEKIPEKDLKKILEAGRWAPSAGNRQPLEIILVKKQKNKTKLSKSAGNQKHIKKAPINIVVCANIPRTKKRYGKRGEKLYAIQDTAAAIQNMLLTAKALNYGTCWNGAFNEKKVSKTINAPEHIRPLAIISLGKPKETPNPPTRRKLDEIVKEETY